MGQYGPSFEQENLKSSLQAEVAADQLCAWDANTRRFGLQSLGLLGPAAAEHVPAMAKLLEDEEPEAGMGMGRMGMGLLHSMFLLNTIQRKVSGTRWLLLCGYPLVI